MSLLTLHGGFRTIMAITTKRNDRPQSPKLWRSLLFVMSMGGRFLKFSSRCTSSKRGMPHDSCWGLCTSGLHRQFTADHYVDNTFPYLYYRRQHADCQARFTAYRRALPAGRKPLPLGEVSPKVTERASPSQPVCYAAISRSHCRSDTIATLTFLRQHPCPLRRFAPAPPKWEPLACRSGPR